MWRFPGKISIGTFPSEDMLWPVYWILYCSEIFTDLILDEMITTDEVIKELFEIADKKVPEQVVDRDEIRGELDELNEGTFDSKSLLGNQVKISEAEMTHEELLKKYNVNATEFNEQKEEIANIFLKELANMQQAEAEGWVSNPSRISFTFKNGYLNTGRIGNLTFCFSLLHISKLFQENICYFFFLFIEFSSIDIIFL